MDSALSSSAASAVAAPPRSAAADAAPLFGTVTIRYVNLISDAFDIADHECVAKDLLRADYYDYKEKGVDNMLVERDGKWNTQRVGVHGRGVEMVIYAYIKDDLGKRVAVSEYRVKLCQTKEEQDSLMRASPIFHRPHEIVLPLSDATFNRTAASYDDALRADGRAPNRESYELSIAALNRKPQPPLMPAYSEEEGIDLDIDDSDVSDESGSDSSDDDGDEKEKEGKDDSAQAEDEEEGGSSGEESEDYDPNDIMFYKHRLEVLAERKRVLFALPMDKRIEAAVKDMQLPADDSVIALMIHLSTGDYKEELEELAAAINKPDVSALTKCKLFWIPGVKLDIVPEMIELAKETWSDFKSPLRVAYQTSLMHKPAGKWFHAALKRAINNEPHETRRFFELAGMFGLIRKRLAQCSVAAGGSSAGAAAAATAESKESEEDDDMDDDDDEMSYEDNVALMEPAKRCIFNLPMDKRLVAVAKNLEFGPSGSVIYNMISSFHESGLYSNELKELSAAINEPGVSALLQCRLAGIPRVELSVTPEMMKLAEETWKDIESPLRVAYTSSHFKTISDVTFVDRLKDAIRKENSDLRLQFYLQGLNDVDGGEDFPVGKRRPDEFPREIKERVTEDNLSDDGKDKDVPSASNKRKEPAAAAASSHSAAIKEDDFGTGDATLSECNTLMDCMSWDKRQLFKLPMDKRVDAALDDVQKPFEFSVVRLAVAIYKKDGSFKEELLGLAEAVNRPEVSLATKRALSVVPGVVVSNAAAAAAMGPNKRKEPAPASASASAEEPKAKKGKKKE
jgi:hypothetical protein